MNLLAEHIHNVKLLLSHITAEHTHTLLDWVGKSDWSSVGERSCLIGQLFSWSSPDASLPFRAGYCTTSAIILAKNYFFMFNLELSKNLTEWQNDSWKVIVILFKVTFVSIVKLRIFFYFTHINSFVEKIWTLFSGTFIFFSPEKPRPQENRWKLGYKPCTVYSNCTSIIGIILFPN
jgi:hypothetical protein